MQLTGCSENNGVRNKTEKVSAPIPWWESVDPITIDGDKYYGKSCSVTRISDRVGSKYEQIIFEAPSRAFTYCAQSVPGKNYLGYDGEYIILHVDRQTLGAGAWTGERYRSADFKSWEEYIGVTWVNGEEHEAWRKVGSTSSNADSTKRVLRD